ncbi:MAG TPA: amino acid ABC transporter permease [Solirubrobacteraceae bacterium]|nr:amino acid ABC transporter permease [Solirubrobacteraceae bacterium]
MQPTPTTRAERQLARRRRARRSIAISAGSTAVVILGVALAILLSPGWRTVREKFLSWHFFKMSLSSLPTGFWVDVRMFLIIEAIVLVLGLAIALIRTLPAPVLFPVRAVAVVFVDVMRGVPTLILLYIFGFGFLALGFSFIPGDETILGGAALACSYSAYVSEVFRAGIESVNPSQPAAALAVGLTRTQALRYVVLPQAIRAVVPPLLNDFIGLTKDVALVSILGPQEIARIAQINADYYFNYTPYVAAAVFYLVITLPLIRIVDHMRYRGLQRQNALVLM